MHAKDGHHGTARHRHFEMTHGHEPHHDGDGAHDGHLRHHSDHKNKSHMHNAVRHLTDEAMLAEKPIESHLPKHHPDKPGV